MPSSLKLPLRFLKAGWDEELRFFFRIEDADNNVVALTPHRAEIIVAALEADANGTEEHIDWDAMDVRKVWRQMNRYSVYLETQGNHVKDLERQLARVPNAEEGEQDG